MTDKPYSELELFIRSLAGVAKFTDEENRYIESQVNVRAREAYNMTDAWPRYLRVGHRTAVRKRDGILYVEVPEGGTPILLTLGHPFQNTEAMRFEFYLEGDEAVLIGEDTQRLNGSTVNLTYKTPMPVISSGADSPVPQEFFHFIGQATYSDFLRADGQNDKARVEGQLANVYLFNELQQPNVTRNNNLLYMHIRTNYGEALNYLT